MATEKIDVTQEQFDRIEGAWAVCAYGNGRRIAGAWANTFRACVQQVIGREVPESFALRVIA